MELRSVRIIALAVLGLAAALLIEQMQVYVLSAMTLAPLALPTSSSQSIRVLSISRISRE
ncbi:MAG TPA: hypothetical protein VF532_12090 [Candidatus Angelobacter sp.]